MTIASTQAQMLPLIFSGNEDHKVVLAPGLRACARQLKASKRLNSWPGPGYIAVDVYTACPYSAGHFLDSSRASGKYACCQSIARVIDPGDDVSFVIERY